MNELEIVSSLDRGTVIHSTNLYHPSLITLLLGLGGGEHVMKGVNSSSISIVLPLAI